MFEAMDLDADGSLCFDELKYAMSFHTMYGVQTGHYFVLLSLHEEQCLRAAMHVASQVSWLRMRPKAARSSPPSRCVRATPPWTPRPTLTRRRADTRSWSASRSASLTTRWITAWWRSASCSRRCKIPPDTRAARAILGRHPLMPPARSPRMARPEGRTPADNAVAAQAGA
uniref:EF-hand domain-containing protein n=1 Tax=Chlamydomonas euryale TaxID=1486919 RepID=A0A7R9YVT5_9CHLO